MDEPGATAPMPSGIVLAPIEDTIGWANDLRLSA
jgi:hypothetical protein